MLSSYCIKNLGHQSLDFDPTKEIRDGHIPRVETIFKRQPLISTLLLTYGRANLSKCLVGNFIPKDDDRSINLAFITFTNGGVARIVVQNVKDGALGAQLSMGWQHKP